MTTPTNSWLRLQKELSRRPPIAFLVLCALGLASTLQGWYEKVYDQPTSTDWKKQLRNRALWVAGLAINFYLLVVVGSQTGPAGGKVLIFACELVISVVFWWWSLHVLLLGRASWPALFPRRAGHRALPHRSRGVLRAVVFQLRRLRREQLRPHRRGHGAPVVLHRVRSVPTPRSCHRPHVERTPHPDGGVNLTCHSRGIDRIIPHERHHRLRRRRQKLGAILLPSSPQPAPTSPTQPTQLSEPAVGLSRRAPQDPARTTRGAEPGTRIATPRPVHRGQLDGTGRRLAARAAPCRHRQRLPGFGGVMPSGPRRVTCSPQPFGSGTLRPVHFDAQRGRTAVIVACRTISGRGKTPTEMGVEKCVCRCRRMGAR